MTKLNNKVRELTIDEMTVNELDLVFGGSVGSAAFKMAREISADLVRGGWFGDAREALS